MDFWEALASQPEALTRSQRAVQAQLERLDPARWPSGRTIVVGLGASYHAGICARAAFWEAGAVLEVRAPAQLGRPRPPEEGDLIVALSQSGRSVETLEALRRLDPASVLLLSADAGSPAARAAGGVVDLGVPEDCEVRVVGFSATVVALELLAAWRSGRLDQAGPVGSALGALDERARAFGLAAWDRFGDAFALDVVASERFVGVAGEGALLLREGARVPSAAYETHQYLHGPLEAAGPRCGVVLLGGERERELACDLGQDGVPVALVDLASGASDDSGVDDSPVLSLAGLDGLVRTLGATAALQHLTGAFAAARGLKPGEFRRPQRDTKVA